MKWKISLVFLSRLNIKKIIIMVSYLKLNTYFCRDVFIEKHNFYNLFVT